MYARKYHDPEMVEAAQRLSRRVISVIELGQASGEVMAGDPAQIGTAAFTPAYGIATLVGSKILSVEAMHGVLDTALRIVVDGLKP
ncbi:hypothetical protein [Micromonospora sp. SH-82]|uniref:hypothetical protein n=1 Tax=Micromonospora sp. SH-82 TaxID=3132938 RepID=UPI003EB95639